MSYLARLKAEFSEKRLPSELTKPTKAPSVSFVGAQGRHISEIGEREPRPEAYANALPDPAAEARRRRVLAMLAEHPEARYAALTDTEAAPGFVLLTLAIRDLAAVDLLIPAEKWDGVLLLDLVERHGGTIH